MLSSILKNAYDLSRKYSTISREYDLNILNFMHSSPTHTIKLAELNNYFRNNKVMRYQCMDALSETMKTDSYLNESGIPIMIDWMYDWCKKEQSKLYNIS